MTFREWARETKRSVSEDGWTGLRFSAYKFYTGFHRRLDRFVSYGTPIWAHDWDVLLILDACRADLLEEVVDDYDFLDAGRTNSVAGGSRSWMLRNFDDQYREATLETLYVTGNPFSDDVLEADWFHEMDEVWRYGWDDELNTVPARALTDVAIRKWRSTDADRMIVHYMQPHHPFVPNPMDSGMNRDDLSNPDRTVWHKLRDGDVDRDAVWEAYLENLRYVLDDVALLLENVDADTVAISADHGNGMGEYGYYGHGDVILPHVRTVPWVVTSGTDTGTHEPNLTQHTEPESEGDAIGDDVQSKLEDLGYL